MGTLAEAQACISQRIQSYPNLENSSQRSAFLDTAEHNGEVIRDCYEGHQVAGVEDALDAEVDRASQWVRDSRFYAALPTEEKSEFISDVAENIKDSGSPWGWIGLGLGIIVLIAAGGAGLVHLFRGVQIPHFNGVPMGMGEEVPTA